MSVSNLNSDINKQSLDIKCNSLISNSVITEAIGITNLSGINNYIGIYPDGNPGPITAPLSPSNVQIQRASGGSGLEIAGNYDLYNGILDFKNTSNVSNNGMISYSNMMSSEMKVFVDSNECIKFTPTSTQIQTDMYMNQTIHVDNARPYALGLDSFNQVIFRDVPFLDNYYQELHWSNISFPQDPDKVVAMWMRVGNTVTCNFTVIQPKFNVGINRMILYLPVVRATAFTDDYQLSGSATIADYIGFSSRIVAEVGSIETCIMDITSSYNDPSIIQGNFSYTLI